MTTTDQPIVKRVRKKIVNRAHDFVFSNVHRRRLIYNSCWEDPRIDRELLQLDDTSKVVMITSAGCNALDYLLDSPAAVHCIDMNPRQNALLHLKLALIRHKNFDELFTMFGVGSHEAYRDLYSRIRGHMPSAAQEFWDHKITYFSRNNRRRSFYYHGTSGDVAWFMKQYWQANKKLKRLIYDMLSTQTLEEQRLVYDKVEPKLWNAFMRWLVKHPLVMTMVGVPRPQIQLIMRDYPGGLVGYARDNLKHVLTEVLMRENYFWRVYLTGSYSPGCCPNYLKEENYDLLRANGDRVFTYTMTIADFLKTHPGQYTHFILLDHQDWLAYHAPDALLEEWQLILQNSVPGSKILMRSAGLDVDFIPDSIKSSLRFFPEKTESLHLTDRVGTYGSLHFAEVTV